MNTNVNPNRGNNSILVLTMRLTEQRATDAKNDMKSKLITTHQ